jgi:hypothetical protein
MIPWREVEGNWVAGMAVETLAPQQEKGSD